MLRRFMMNRRRGYATPYRRGSFVTYSFSATVVVVSLLVILALYLLGYLAL